MKSTRNIQTANGALAPTLAAGFTNDMADAKLTPEVRAILERSTITDHAVILPPEQLARPLYEAVNKVLVNAGGKWNRGARAHIFKGDPRTALGLVLETGVAVDQKKKFQSFYTPTDLANELAVQANVSGFVVLEPSAGDGALVSACNKFGAKSIVAVEIRDEMRAALLALAGTVMTCDFLNMTPCEWPPFDRIVMNPPFTRNQDIRHAEHALKFLARGGRLVAVMMGTAEHRKQLATALKGYERWSVGQRGDCPSYSIRDVPRGTFKESGTDVATFNFGNQQMKTTLRVGDRVAFKSPKGLRLTGAVTDGLMLKARGEELMVPIIRPRKTQHAKCVADGHAHQTSTRWIARSKVRKLPKAKWRLKLIIERVEDWRNDSEFAGYDLDNSKPWPLGDYATEAKAIEARNAMVVVEKQ
jgi:predicted RNA methylase